MDDNNVGSHDGGADVSFMETGSTLTTSTAISTPPLPTIYLRRSHLLSRSGERDQEVPRAAGLAHMLDDVPRQLQQHTAGYVSTGPTAQRTARP